MAIVFSLRTSWLFQAIRIKGKKPFGIEKSENPLEGAATNRSVPCHPLLASSLGRQQTVWRYQKIADIV